MKSSCLSLLVLSCLCSAWAAKVNNLPSSWKVCKQSDPQFQGCIKESVSEVLKKLVKGEPSLGVLPIDPLRLTKLNLGQGNGPVSIDLEFRDLDMIGLANLRITETTVDPNNYKLEAKMAVDSPLFLTGDYTIKGKVLVLPITGTGKCNLTLQNPTLEVTVTGHKIEKHGEAYMSVDDFRFNIDTSRLSLNLENLFGGNKELGATMNTFLNDNWQEIFKELKPAISDGFGEAFKQISNRIFSKVPYSKIFPK